jgi:lipopolysaccharide/colanic/teichoic acid biosynthesis glycosyltransferase
VAFVGETLQELQCRSEFLPQYLEGSREQQGYLFIKRALDIFLAVFMLIALFPVLLLVALLIKLDSPGPVFFVQDRVGARPYKKNGGMLWELTRFRCYKFRSMFHKCDQASHRRYVQQFCSGEWNVLEPVEGAKFKLANDCRTTFIGRTLRKTSLDELPQLLNVLKGEMSLVGPRPVPVYEVQMYRHHHYGRLGARPGITGLWQIKGRGRVHFEEMIAMDIEYIRTCSLWLDLHILCLTVPAVLSGRGAS